MKKELVNFENKKIKDIDINDNVWGVKVLPDIIHQYIRYQNAKSRQGSHKTKTRSEVNGRANAITTHTRNIASRAESITLTSN